MILRSLARIAVGLALAMPCELLSQNTQQPLQLEGRLDAIIAHTTGFEAGLGASVPAGLYVRSGIVVGVGAGRHGAEGRTDLIARFSLDPFRQSRWAPYGGVGISGRYRSRLDGGSRAYLLVFLGVEGPLATAQRSGVVPAFELGLGGGARIGVILRRGIASRR
jgi:hypothetical protein